MQILVWHRSLHYHRAQTWVGVENATNLRRLSVAAVKVVMPAEKCCLHYPGAKGSVTSQTCSGGGACDGEAGYG